MLLVECVQFGQSAEWIMPSVSQPVFHVKLTSSLRENILKKKKNPSLRFYTVFGYNFKALRELSKELQSNLCTFKTGEVLIGRCSVRQNIYSPVTVFSFTATKTIEQQK